MSTQHIDRVINNFRENKRRLEETGKKYLRTSWVVQNVLPDLKKKEELNSYAVPEQRQRISWLTSSQPTSPVSQNCDI